MYNIKRVEEATIALDVDIIVTDDMEIRDSVEIEDRDEMIENGEEDSKDLNEAVVAEGIKMKQPSLFSLIKVPEKDLSEIKQIIIEKMKLGNLKLKRKREEAEQRREREKRARKSNLTDKELGCKGYVNATLVSQIDLITNFDKYKKKIIINKIHIIFLRYIEKCIKYSGEDKTIS